MKKIILAIVGLAGAGKTEATNYLVKKTGWPKIYFGQAIIDEAKGRGLPLSEENERKVREELRAKHGMQALAVANLGKIMAAFETSPVIIESMYSWEEYLFLKKEFGQSFKVLAIYSSFATREGRMKTRPERPLTPEQLESRDVSQIENLHQAGPIARADYTIVNEGSLEEMFGKIDEILNTVASS